VGSCVGDELPPQADSAIAPNDTTRLRHAGVCGLNFMRFPPTKTSTIARRGATRLQPKVPAWSGAVSEQRRARGGDGALG